MGGSNFDFQKIMNANIAFRKQVQVNIIFVFHQGNTLPRVQIGRKIVIKFCTGIFEKQNFMVLKGSRRSVKSLVIAWFLTRQTQISNCIRWYICKQRSLWNSATLRTANECATLLSNFNWTPSFLEMLERS